MANNPLLPLLSPTGRKQYQNVSVKELIGCYRNDTEYLTDFDKEKIQAVEEAIEIYTRTPDLETSMHSTSSAINFFAPLLERKNREEVVLALLNTKNKIIHYETIFTGSLYQCVIHPREIFHVVLKYPTARFMIAHNHPSGDPEPSEADLQVTERFQDIGKLIGIPLLDHIIIGENGNHISLKERNHL